MLFEKTRGDKILHVSEIPKILFDEFVKKLLEEKKIKGVRKIKKDDYSYYHYKYEFDIAEFNDETGAIAYHKDGESKMNRHTVFTILSLSEDHYKIYRWVKNVGQGWAESLFVKEILHGAFAIFDAGPMAFSSELTNDVRDELKIYFPMYKGLLPVDHMTPFFVSVLSRASELVSSPECERPKYYAKGFVTAQHY